MGFRLSFRDIVLEARRGFGIRISDLITLYIFRDYEHSAHWEDLKTPIWLISEPECVPVFQSREWDAVSGTLYLAISV